jgi:hypothetical protein
MEAEALEACSLRRAFKGHAHAGAVPLTREERGRGIRGWFEAHQDRVQVGMDRHAPNAIALRLSEGEDAPLDVYIAPRQR